jgi:sugar phosphate permease
MKANQRYLNRSRILEAVSNLAFLAIISLCFSISYNLTKAYLSGILLGMQSKSLMSVILLTIFCPIASITLLFMDRCSLINEMTKTLHDVRI